MSSLTRVVNSDDGEGWTLGVARGNAAVASALTAERLQDWRCLAAEAKQVAVYQAPDFVLTWFEVYASIYEPLLLLAHTPEDRLVGVLPLAMQREGPQRLVFAGAEHCEYAGWLASSRLQDEFLVACLVRLQADGLLPKSWDWKWLAPGTSLAWLDHLELRLRGITVRLRETGNPLAALQEPCRARFFDSGGKNYKRKINRLKALGRVGLVQLHGDALSEELFLRFQMAYDIRALARYATAPFRDDPLKGPFHLRLLERAPGTALLFALMAGSTPVAFHLCIADKRRAIHCMAPFDPRWEHASPGKLVADLVGDVLRDRGFEYFDHTPGGDEYKEEAASAHETVCSLLLFSSRWQRWAVDLQVTLWGKTKQVALWMGFRAHHARRIRRLMALLRGRDPLSLVVAALRAFRRCLWSRDAMVFYRYDREDWEHARQGGGPDPRIHRDTLEDFLLYSGANRWVSRQELMAVALERLAANAHCYTIVERGILVHYGWMNPEEKSAEVTEVGMRLECGDRTAALYDFYTEPSARGAGLYKRNLKHMLGEAFTAGARRVIIGALDSNTPSRRAIEAVGFKLDRRLIHLRICGRSWRWEVREP